MAIKGTAFKRKNEEKTEQRDRVTVHLKEKDRIMVEEAKWALNIDMDSPVIMVLARAGWNGIRTNFSPEFLHYLTRGDRARVIRNKPESLKLAHDL